MITLAVVPLLAAATLSDTTAPRNATIDAAGAKVVHVVALAGRLLVTGRDGAARVEVRGTARASDREYMAEIQLETRRDGDVIEVRALIPERNFIGIGRFERALDLDIVVPAGVRLEVEDGSGDLEIRHVAALELRDGSGDARIADVGGELRVHDGSGDLEIERVRGDVILRDGSGTVQLRTVGGSVTVEDDGSGDIEASDVTGSVLVERDGSGSIRATRVGGDLTVDHDGSGGVSYDAVKGTIRIPKTRAERRREARRRVEY